MRVPSPRTLLLLTRAPLAFTAIADGIAGYLLATVRIARAVTPGASDAFPHENPEGRSLALAAVASASLYLAGMTLNDFFDRERDRTLAPNRPIPSGRVSPAFALALGLALIALGIGAGALGGGPRAALGASAVAGFVLLYDAFLKRSRVGGALGMGLCRASNVITGALIASAHGLGPAGGAVLAPKLAIASGTYVFALTLLSTFEDEDPGKVPVVFCFLGAAAAPVALICVLPAPLDGAPFTAAHLVVIAWLATRALRLGTKATGHQTTRWLIRGLFLLDLAALGASWLVGAFVALIYVLLAVGSIGGAALLFRPPKKKPEPAPDQGQL